MGIGESVLCGIGGAEIGVRFRRVPFVVAGLPPTLTLRNIAHVESDLAVDLDKRLGTELRVCDSRVRSFRLAGLHCYYMSDNCAT